MQERFIHACGIVKRGSKVVQDWAWQAFQQGVIVLLWLAALAFCYYWAAWFWTGGYEIATIQRDWGAQGACVQLALIFTVGGFILLGVGLAGIGFILAEWCKQFRLAILRKVGKLPPV